MIFIPKDTAILKGLNSYYLDLARLLEHQQGEIGSGGLHLNSNALEGVIFFDKDELLAGIIKDHNGHDSGPEVIHRLIRATENNNFVVNIYSIDPEMVYYWANLPNAETIYKNLTTEFSSLERLVTTMGNNRLTGYIDITFDHGKESGIIFLHQGEIIGSFYSGSPLEVGISNKNLNLIIRKSETSDSAFNVSRIFSSKRGLLDQDARETASPQKDGRLPPGIVLMLQELLVSCDNAFNTNKKKAERFETLLRKKFIKYADLYSFLDPFAGEFEYSAGRVSMKGAAEDDELAKGVLVSLREFFYERGLQPEFNTTLTAWAGKYKSEIKQLGIQL